MFFVENSNHHLQILVGVEDFTLTIQCSRLNVQGFLEPKEFLKKIPENHK